MSARLASASATGDSNLALVSISHPSNGKLRLLPLLDMDTLAASAEASPSTTIDLGPLPAPSTTRPLLPRVARSRGRRRSQSSAGSSRGVQGSKHNSRHSSTTTSRASSHHRPSAGVESQAAEIGPSAFNEDISEGCDPGSSIQHPLLNQSAKREASENLSELNLTRGRKRRRLSDPGQTPSGVVSPSTVYDKLNDLEPERSYHTHEPLADLTSEHPLSFVAGPSAIHRPLASSLAPQLVLPIGDGFHDTFLEQPGSSSTSDTHVVLSSQAEPYGLNSPAIASRTDALLDHDLFEPSQSNIRSTSSPPSVAGSPSHSARSSPILSVAPASPKIPPGKPRRVETPKPPPDYLHTFTCPVCFSAPTNATLTPCGHIMCGECLFSAVNASVARTGVHNLGARCPVCRAIIPGWDGRGGGVIGLKPKVLTELS